jgi:hypothetical protein
MSARFDLSILRFRKRAKTEKTAATLPESRKKKSPTASNPPEAAGHPDVTNAVIVDLENLTKENLAAFFPSEHAPEQKAATAAVPPTRRIPTSTPSETSGEESL